MSLHWTNQNACRQRMVTMIRQIFLRRRSCRPLSTFVCNFPLLLTMAPQQQQLPPSAVQKELQRTVCIVGYEKVFEKDSMKKKQLEQVVHDEVHGKGPESRRFFTQRGKSTSSCSQVEIELPMMRSDSPIK
jgi:hypothetical protein